MILFPAESTTKNIISYFGDYLHIKSPSSTDSRSFGNVARMIEIKFRILEKVGQYIFRQWEAHLSAFKLRLTWEKMNTDTTKIYMLNLNNMITY